jgi:hypothetical protein
MNYIPKPLDTSAVKLSDDLHELTEQLAENAHDVWARRKLADGWTWGPAVDAAQKKHTDLIPYDQLPEDKKEYDRDTAMETIKAILSLGYTVERPSKPRKK